MVTWYQTNKVGGFYKAGGPVWLLPCLKPPGNSMRAGPPRFAGASGAAARQRGAPTPTEIALSAVLILLAAAAPASARRGEAAEPGFPNRGEGEGERLTAASPLAGETTGAARRAALILSAAGAPARRRRGDETARFRACCYPCVTREPQAAIGCAGNASVSRETLAQDTRLEIRCATRAAEHVRQATGRHAGAEHARQGIDRYAGAEHGREAADRHAGAEHERIGCGRGSRRPAKLSPEAA